MEALGLNLEEKLKLVSRLRDGFGMEVNDDKSVRKKMGVKYNSFEGDFEKDLDAYSSAKKDESNHLINILAKWERDSTQTFKQIKDVHSRGELLCSMEDLIASILHMHNNRMFKANGRHHELLIHDFLRRYYFKASKRRPTPNQSSRAG
jgi:thiopeptide-type bacteriocin biosynthesis protein